MPSASEQSALKVSVIIPTYNRAGYLREALNSVFVQSLAPWEVIVVDDGSTDDTRQVIQSAPGPIRCFEQAHLGVAAARNRGLENASGDLIAWLDSDDLWEPDFLATVVSILMQDDTLDGVYTGITMIDAAGEALRTAIRVEPPDELHEALMHTNFLATPAVVVRRRCYHDVGGFDTRLRIAEDADIWLRLTRRFRFVGVAQPLVRIRVHEGNLMADAEAFREAQLQYARKRTAELDGDGSEFSDAARAVYGYTHRSIALKYIQSGQQAEGWDHLSESASTYPEILTQLDTFYELACGDQARGHRGDAKRLDIERNGTEMIRRLDQLLTASSPDVQALRGVAFGNAYLALGMLSDQAGYWSRARNYLFRALWENPTLAVAPGVLRRLLKVTFLRPQLVAAARLRGQQG